jgi:hypothetical protein
MQPMKQCRAMGSGRPTPDGLQEGGAGYNSCRDRALGIPYARTEDEQASLLLPSGNASAVPKILLSIVKGIHDFRKCGDHRGYQCLRDLRAMTLSVGSGSCNIRLVCTIHASASDLSRKPGIRLHLALLRLFISTLNECPFSEITRYAMLTMPPNMARRNWIARLTRSQLQTRPTTRR